MSEGNNISEDWSAQFFFRWCRNTHRERMKTEEKCHKSLIVSQCISFNKEGWFYRKKTVFFFQKVFIDTTDNLRSIHHPIQNKLNEMLLCRMHLQMLAWLTSLCPLAVCIFWKIFRWHSSKRFIYSKVRKWIDNLEKWSIKFDLKLKQFKDS